MKNLKIDSVRKSNISFLKSSDSNYGQVETFTVDTILDNLYVATNEALVIISSGEVVGKIAWAHIKGDSPVINLTVRHGDEAVAVLADGRVILCQGEEVEELEVAFLNPESSDADWSADEQNLALADGENVFFVDASLALYGQRELQFADNERLNAPVNVGWGSEQTQFRGSAGKYKKEAEVEKEVINQRTAKSMVKWRSDNEFVAISHVIDGFRNISLFDVTGSPLSRMKSDGHYLGGCFALKPNSNLICSTTLEKDNRDRLIFFERNGETRNGLEVKWSRTDGERHVESIFWNCDSSILAMQVQKSNEKFVEFWRLSNYEFTKKISWPVPVGEEVEVKWSAMVESKIYILLKTSVTFTTIDVTACSSYSPSLELNVVVASDDLRVSRLTHRCIPPPMAETVLTIGEDVQALATSPGQIHVMVNGKIVSYTQIEEGATKFERSEEVPLTKEISFGTSLVMFDGHFFFIINTRTTGKSNVVKLLPDGTYTTPWSTKKNDQIVWLGVNQHDHTLEMAQEDGHFMSFNHEDCSVEPLFRIDPLSTVQVAYLESKRVILADNSALYIDSRSICKNATSVLVRNSDVLFIDLDNKLRFLTEESGYQNVNQESRDVEAGCDLVACHSKSTNLILQANRGNLEGIQPRRFVIEQVKLLLDKHLYIEALKMMKKHRVDLSFILKYLGDTLLNDVDQLLLQSQDCQLLEQLVVSATEDNDTILQGSKLAEKLGEAIWNQSDIDKKTKFMPVLLTCLLRQTPPNVKEAMKRITEHAVNVVERRDVFTRNCLHHVTFFVEAKTLFSTALATYDLQLAQQVAEASNQDPREYLPVLNRLNKIECKLERRYRIDEVREAWTDVIADLFVLDDTKKGDDQWLEKAIDVVQQQGLYREALNIIGTDSRRFKTICELYGLYLEKNCAWREAATLFELSGNVEKSLKSWELAREPSQLLAVAARFGLDSTSQNPALIRIATALEASGRYNEAAATLALTNTQPEKTVKLYCTAHEWQQALNSIKSIIDFSNLSREAIVVQTEAVSRAVSIKEDVRKRNVEFERHQARLTVVRKNKESRLDQFTKGEVDDLRDDVSIASSISSRSSSSRSSVASTVRRRKAIEKKKNSLKEGGEYEDSALLNALAAHYNWLVTIKDEISQLSIVLVALGKLEDAFSLESELEAWKKKLEKCRSSIWPEVVYPHHLPGPLYALFNPVDEQPETSVAMPPVIRLEPELYPPSKDNEFQKFQWSGK